MNNYTETRQRFWSIESVYKLVKDPDGRKISFVSNDSGIFYLFLFFEGVSVFTIYLILSSSEVPAWKAIFPFFFFVLFYLFHKNLKKYILVFDIDKREYYTLNIKTGNRIEKIPFSDIKDIEILFYRHCTSGSGCHNACKLNLILKNERVNLFAHSKCITMMEDAKVLSDLLNVNIKKTISDRFPSRYIKEFMLN